ncbi:sodium/hydrogen exchanger family protein [Emericellopsis cladophorae]|uniref:Sodium/hydrogen exchanger family protein n=1 Tax=Emericellopsis cladophorae TaxID=2686198 RepID=A0A9P9Y9G1_9HYPO|nr:sodium/hydrogen exchanger family protein [Emericellopsis cladophorae]KAI6785234.1 sodium/hydrogen exchanger family protein [Emericellopsis cladophorae]
MPTLALTNFNILVGFLGGWISLFGLVSFLCKETFYLSEALISLLAGVAFSPAAANLIRPLEYAGTQANVEAVTLAFSRLVLGVQFVLAGVQLPSKYLRVQWRPMTLLVGLVMTCMWLSTSLLVWAMVPSFPFLYALAVGSCVTPTDPVLSNVIVKGRFADHNIPKDLQDLIISESGANDGLGYPFLFLALYLIKHVGAHGEQGSAAGAGTAIGLWFGETWGYTILLSIIYGAATGLLAKVLLKWAEDRKYVDRESFLVFAISLALFIVGTCGMIGSDDVLACFIAGNAFTWDDWFRLETADDSFQPTIDMLLNVTIFMWYGAVIPWHEFVHNNVIPIYRLIPLGVLALMLRRLPFVFAVHRWIPQIEQAKQAIFVGFFGPIGVSAVFYLYVTLEFIDGLAEGSNPAPDLDQFKETVRVVVWFLAVVHGLSIPLGKLGYYAPRTLTRNLSVTSGDEADTNQRAVRVRGRVSFPLSRNRAARKQPTGDAESQAQTQADDEYIRMGPRLRGSVIPLPPTAADQSGDKPVDQDQGPLAPIPELPNRSIRFLDHTPPPDKQGN